MRVFVSSTRVDADWTDQLCAFLSDRGFKPMLDGRDIGSADVWKHRVKTLLSSVEAVVFVLTDDSAEAIECEWEISEAQRQGKRVVAVLPAALQVRPPDFLAERNFILFYSDPVAPESGFYAGQKRLEAALRQKPLNVRVTRPIAPPTPPPRAPPPREPIMMPYDPAYLAPPQRRGFRMPWFRLGLLAAVGGASYYTATNEQFRSGLGTAWTEASAVLLAPAADEDDAPPDGSRVSAHDWTPESPLFAGASGANARNYPLPSATILQELPAAAPLNINGRMEVQGDWWFRVVLEDGRVGFVHEEATASRPTAPSTAGVTLIDPGVAVRAGRAGANVRASPGLRARRLVRVEAGAALTVTGRTQTGGHRWYRVQLGNDQTGWARDDVLVTAEGQPVRI